MATPWQQGVQNIHWTSVRRKFLEIGCRIVLLLDCAVSTVGALFHAHNDFAAPLMG